MRTNEIKEKGITLVALVVTIIILLILAGVTISQIGGNNGLFSKVRQAVGIYKNASLDEESSIKEIEKGLSEFEILGKVEAITAKEEDVLLGKTYYDENRNLHTGTMTNSKMTVKAIKSEYAFWDRTQSAKAETSYTIQKDCTCIAIALLNCIGGSNGGGPYLLSCSAEIKNNDNAVSAQYMIGQVYYDGCPKMYMFDAKAGDVIYVSCSASTQAANLCTNAIIMTDENLQ